MDSRTFLGLEPTPDPSRWALPVTPAISTSGDFMFGGCGLGAGIAALEGTSGRPCVWATAQYLSYAKPGETVDIDVTLAVVGHQITQARAVCRVGDREILTVNAALGDRPMAARGQWEQPPAAPSPDDCPERVPRAGQMANINGRIEQRIVKAHDPAVPSPNPRDGRTVVWSRLTDVISGIDAAALAVMGDFVPFGVAQALSTPRGGNSLDNTLRICRLVPTEWVLLDIQVHAAERGFGHGLVHMFAQDGTLLATASQSCILRVR